MSCVVFNTPLTSSAIASGTLSYAKPPPKHHKQSGVVLFMVLVLLGIVGLFGIGAFKSGITQLHISGQGAQYDRAELAVESAQTCLISEFLAQGAADMLELLLAVNANLSIDTGKITKGCHAGVDQRGRATHRYNDTYVATVAQYCGRGVVVGSDVEAFETKRYLFVSRGFDEEDRRRSALIKQAWVRAVPKDQDRLDPMFLSEWCRK